MVSFLDPEPLPRWHTIGNRILDTSHQVLITHAIYWYAVAEFGNADALSSPVWSIIASFPVFAVMQSTIRIIFSVRIWNMNSRIDGFANRRKYLIIALIFASSIGEFSIVTVVAMQEAMFGYLDSPSTEAILLYFGLSLCVVGDMLIAYAQLVVLKQWRTGFRNTDSVLRILMLYCINSALLTSLCALGNLITFAAFPGTLIFQAFYFVLPKLLLNACLATLNARRTLRHVMNDTRNLDVITVPNFRSLRSPSLRFTSGNDEGAPHDAIDIRIDKSTSIKLDPLPGIAHDDGESVSMGDIAEQTDAYEGASHTNISPC